MSSLNLLGRMLKSLILISCWFHSPEAARILMIPANINSHIMYFSQLGEGLASLGHKVELLHPANVIMPSLEEPNQNYTMTSYEVSTEIPFFNSREASETLLEIALTGSSWKRFSLFEKFVKKYDEAYDLDCIDLLENKQLMDRIRRSEFQFAIMDPIIATECYFMVPLILGIPYGAFSINTMPTGSFRVPRLPSFVSFIGTGYSDEMTFLQRLTSFSMELILIQNLIFWSKPAVAHFASRYHPNGTVTTYHEIWQNASLWFYLEDVALGFPRPNMPNTVSVGDIMAGSRSRETSTIGSAKFSRSFARWRHTRLVW